MARKHEKIERKTTSSGIEITMLDNTIIKIYSSNARVFMTFASHKDAKKEFSKHRQGYKKL